MWDELVRWVYGLTVILILGGILLRAAPKGIHQKFLRFFFGILLLLAVFSPVLDLLGISDRAATDYEDLLFSLEQSLNPSGGAEDWREASLRRREASMQEPLQALVGEYGYELLQADLEWDGDGTELTGMTLTVRQMALSDRGEEGSLTGSISPVEEIRPIDPVGGDSEEVEGAGTIGVGETDGDSSRQALSEILQSVFSLPEAQIRLIVR